MKGLMLHCGAQLKTRQEVFAVPAPPGTATYTPLPYESFLKRIEKQLAVEGIQIFEQGLALAKDGQRLFGLMTLKMPEFVAPDYGCVLGLRTSYDKSLANGVCIGATVFVCDNLSFQGEVTFERKHTAGMLRDLSWMISETVSTLPMRFAAQSVSFEAYKQRKLSDNDVHDLAIRLWDVGALGLLEIPKFINEWREPRYPEFVQTGKTAWLAFNAATEVAKGDLWRLPARTKAIHNVFDDVCKIQQLRNDSSDLTIESGAGIFNETYTKPPVGSQVKRYRGTRTHDGCCEVTVSDAAGREQMLSPRFDLRNHSPSGFEWGYSGSGSAQLALALLADACQNDEAALRHYQQFKGAVVAGFNKSSWTITDLEIRRCIHYHSALK